MSTPGSTSTSTSASPLDEQGTAPPAGRPLNGLATLALAYGVIAVAAGLLPAVREVTGSLAVPAIALAATGLANARRLGGTGTKQAAIGLATGIAGLALSLAAHLSA
ncbi:hypothetical protein [Streptomyces sp. BPTC-684]|uniref:hypothetical protein n=1 Tax=Streptomyces sp. BPTC-684 TaxID=3043734 RepID=UPI0024B2006F|nr:hypothetical protein [Streptomyces sp. BPTC-684]WHM41015.1 hypothetical protein QIY60_31890 [Streptomyces sp. BPTC-684]